MLFLAMVAVLPLHTVFLDAWISWKPFLVLAVVLVVLDARDGIRERTWPWHRRATLALLPFGLVVLAGFPGPEFRERYLRLGLAIAVGAAVMLATERRLRTPGMLDRTLRVVYLSGAAMGATAVLFSLAALGTFGPGAVGAIDRLPGVFRVAKPAYLDEGFLALTNWHQDPGYGAAWTVLWAVLALFAVHRGKGSGRTWADAAVLGSLAFAVVMAFSRTGWLSLPIALGAAALVLVRREGFPARRMAALLGASVLVTAVLLAGMFAADPEGVGGDIDLQFAFRLSQGWDLLADLTGLFSTSESFADRFAVSEQRADVWPEYVRMFEDHPLLGVGLSVGWQTNSIGQEPHNLVLELLSETGILGLLAFAGLVTVIVVSGGGALGLVALATTFLPSMTQTVLFEPTWWFAAALCLAGTRIAGRPGLVNEAVSS